MPTKLFIQDVAVRDGFQIESQFIPTEQKIHLINSLSHTGLAKIEVTSFSSPKAIPALADAEQVMRAIERVEGVEYAVLVPNLKGCERALACEVDEINLVMSASQSHSLANLRMTPDQSIKQFSEIAKLVGNSASINVSLSTAFGCPFDGDIPQEQVLTYIQKVTDLGIAKISLCDTTGVANPMQVERLIHAVVERWPDLVITAHFHNTRGMGLANVMAALNAGVTHFDASLGGLGGCPFAPGASGNVCTEDMVHMLQAMGYDTGVNLTGLLSCAHELESILGRTLPGQVIKAGPSTRRYPMPTGDSQQRLSGVNLCEVNPTR